MRIPDGTNFGNAVAQPTQAPTFNANQFGAQEDAAVGQVADAGQGLAEQMHVQQDQLAKTAAMGAYQDHVTNVKNAQQQANQGLAEGKISAADYPDVMQQATKASFDSTIGALPDSQYKVAAQTQTKRLDLATNVATQGTIYKYNQTQMVAQNDDLLDKTGKTIAVDPSNIDQTVASAKAGYLATAQGAGIPVSQAQLKFQNWSDATYAQNAMTTAITARANGDLAGLQVLQKNLTDPDGTYAGKMDANQRNAVLNTVVSHIAQLENQNDAAQNARENAAADAYNNLVKFNEGGHVISPDYAAQLQQQTAGTSLEKQTQAVLQQNANGARFAGMPLANMRASLASDQQTANTTGSDPSIQDRIAARQKILDASQQAYKENPWQATVDRGVLPSVQPIDTSSLQNAVTTIGQRMQQIGVVENQAGRKVSPLEPQEAQAVQQLLAPLGVEAKAAALQGLGKALADPQRIADLSDQWKDKDPAMALAMKMGAMGADGGPLMTANGVPTSTFILAGEKAKRDGTVKVDATADAGLRSTITQKIQGTMPPEQAQDAIDSAYYMAIGSAARNARTVPNNFDVQDSINTATGGISNTGGTPLSGHISSYTVARPYGWTDSQFQSGVKAASAANIENKGANGAPIDTVVANGHQIPVNDFMAKFPSYQLQRVGIGGTYWISTGTRFVDDPSGQHIRVHLNKVGN